MFIGLQIFFLLSFHSKIASSSVNNDNLIKYEKLALKSNKPGKEYEIDLTGIQGCNKSRVKYLGSLTTRKGKKYKFLTSFLVYGTNCRGLSNIKIYDQRNKFIGGYYVGMPYDLPDTLIGNKLFYTKSLQGCPLRKGNSIDFNRVIPKSIFIKCSERGGDIYTFSSE